MKPLASSLPLMALTAALLAAPVARAQAAPPAPPIQLDLRGLRRDEAAEALDRYLNDAYLGGLRQVRIIHGKGKGVLRAITRAVLDRHPLVIGYTDGDEASGSWGATIVVLKDR